MRDYIRELDAARELMAELRQHVRAFDPARLAFQPPVLDRSTGTLWRGEDTQGLKKFTDAIEQQASQLEAVSEARPSSSPSVACAVGDRNVRQACAWTATASWALATRLQSQPMLGPWAPHLRLSPLLPSPWPC